MIAEWLRGLESSLGHLEGAIFCRHSGAVAALVCCGLSHVDLSRTMFRLYKVLLPLNLVQAHTDHLKRTKEGVCVS